MLKTLAVLICSTVGGAIGWWIGAKIGMMTAYFLSTALGGVGIYYGIKFAKEYTP